MAVTREFAEAVTQRNLLRVKIMLKDSLLVDTSFNQFNEMLKYAELRLHNIWISNEEDDEVFSDSPKELNIILAGLVNNFSRRRVAHLKGMIKKLYPPQSETKQAPRRETAFVIRKTTKVVAECHGIDDEKKKIMNICSQISSKNQIDTKDIETLRNAAKNIVVHCDNIEESRCSYGNYK